MRVTIVGFGLGSISGCLPSGLRAIEEADIVIGSPRLLEGADIELSRGVAAVKAEEIISAIASARKDRVCVLFSGDSGFYSGAKRLLPLLSGCDVRVLPGVGSVSYFAAALKTPWQMWRLCSAHGVSCNAPMEVSRNAETFFLTGGENTVETVCRRLTECGMGSFWAAAGCDLGSDSERIITADAASLSQMRFSPLSVLLVRNPRPCADARFGLPDSAFIRGDIPMTKSEVRAVALSKLRIKSTDTVFDIGAGTGSVACEAALLAFEGRVFAIEKESGGCELIEENARALGAFNLECIEGEAPVALSALPCPDAAFIGGSSGRLSEILQTIKQMNPCVRAVVTAVTLETLALATQEMKRLFGESVETVMISVSRAKTAGEHSLMTALNPVYIISGGGKNV